MRPRTPLAAALALVALLAVAAPAAAHVSVQPGEAARGTVADLTIRVPNERDDAATVEIAIQLPGSFETVEPQANGDWTGTVEGDVVRWTGGRLTGEERVELVLRLGPLSGPDQLVLPAVQTYDSGEVVRWIEEGHDSAHPAPVLALTGEEVATTTTTEATTTTTEEPTTTALDEEAVADAGEDGDDGAPVVPIVLAVVVVLVAAGAFAVSRRGRA